MADAPVIFPLAGKRVFVAGQRGMVGSAITRRLADEDCTLLSADRRALDLADPHAVSRWIEDNRPDAVFLAAARVGGIHANNTQRAEFIHDNLAISTSVVHACHLHGVGKLLVLGSSCIYPRLAPQPIPESALLTGELEQTNEPYAIAKIAALKMAQAYRDQYGDDFISVMPTNLYGPGDDYHPENSHVIPGLIRRIHEAKIANAPEVAVWGSGEPRREFMFVDDLADACVFLMKSWAGREHINVGSGIDMTIAELARAIVRTVGYGGKITFDTSRPDGTPRKLLDVSRINALGWKAQTPLETGLKAAYADFLVRAEDAMYA